MKSEQERPIGKIRYEKPTAVDLGPTAPVVGASCVTGRDVGEGDCILVGNSAAQICDHGIAAEAGCDFTGSWASTKCDNGGGF